MFYKKEYEVLVKYTNAMDASDRKIQQYANI